jgi:hypothetical protein
MTPDDPRHGTNAGYGAGCRETCCRDATNRYHKRLVLDHERGVRRLVDVTGTRRRIEALMALGYSGQKIAEAIGGQCGSEDVRQYRSQRVHVNLRTAEAVKRVYELLCMTLPVGETGPERQIISRTRAYARRQGFRPPLAWNNIDDPAARPEIGSSARPKDSLDEVVVERVMRGERLPMTRAERVAVVTRLRAQGMGLVAIEERTGITKPERCITRDETAA